MTTTLPVHISREELHSLEVPATFEATGSFDIRLVNHGRALHVHLHLDDSLSQIADLDAGNHYVDGEDERLIRVDVDADRLNGEQLLGKLKVVSGYGATTRLIDVTVSEPDPDEQSVAVDESLATPPESETEPSTPLVERPTLAVVALGAVALVIAVAAAVVVGETVVLAGSAVLVAGVAVAAALLLREG